MAIDKVVIHGAEFTRIDGRYLLLSEVEPALARILAAAEGIRRLTGLLEDMVTAADRALLEQVQAARPAQETELRESLVEMRAELHAGLALIERMLEGMES